MFNTGCGDGGAVPSGWFKRAFKVGGEGVRNSVDGKICIDSPALVKVANGLDNVAVVVQERVEPAGWSCG